MPKITPFYVLPPGVTNYSWKLSTKHQSCQALSATWVNNRHDYNQFIIQTEFEFVYISLMICNFFIIPTFLFLYPLLQTRAFSSVQFSSTLRPHTLWLWTSSQITVILVGFISPERDVNWMSSGYHSFIDY